VTVYYLGLDVGSLSCDAVVVDAGGRVKASSVVPTGARNREAIERARSNVLAAAGLVLGDLRGTVSTGYGRDRVDGRIAAVTEITCHARGIRALVPGARVLIDIGGQDSKAIRLDPAGAVIDFAMNDKCAAGTGRFLEVMARALEVDLETLSTLDLGATGKLTLSSMCTVFAESEVVSLIAEGAEVREIAAGLNRAVARRVQGLVTRVAPDLAGLTVAMSGGVAYNSGVVRALEAVLESRIVVPASPDTVGALGAALIARDRVAGAPRW
jgi:predicted CoA-substrate-specific enzyme activase